MGSDFDAQIFEELAKAIKLEGSLRDAKAELYKVDDLAKRAELVRDFIAMANTARRQGQPTRIIFGIKEEIERIDADSMPEEVIIGSEIFLTVCGIEGQYIRQALPRNWERLNVAKQADIIDRELHSILRNYIEPEPEWEYQVGHWREKVVGYVEIRPGCTGPYRVKQEIMYEERGRQSKLSLGDAWIREGESKKYIAPHQHHLLYCWRDVPYVRPEVWRQYSNSCVREFPASSPEFPIVLRCKYRDNEMALGEATDQFIFDAQERVICFSGRPGAGKSIFLQDQMHQLSNQLAQYLEALLSDYYPEYPIPVWLDLNGCRFDKESEFIEALVSGLDPLGHLDLRRLDNPTNIFSDENLKFVLLLDAWDELDLNGWTETRRSIISFLQKHANVKAMITSRPSNIEIQRGWAVANITRVSPDTIAGHLKAYLSNALPLVELIDKHQELVDIISNPLALKATLEYAQKVERRGGRLMLSDLVDDIVMELFLHETRKDTGPDHSIKRLQYISSLQELAWWLDGWHEEASLEVALNKLGGGDKGIGRQNMQKGMDMELLKPTREGVTFVTNIIKTYFYVKRLLRLVKEQPKGWWDEVQDCKRLLRLTGEQLSDAKGGVQLAQYHTFWTIFQEMARPWANSELDVLFGNWLARLGLAKRLQYLTRLIQSYVKP